MTLKIDGVDILPYLTQKGLKWQRNDVDGQNSGRTLDGTMHRDRIATKIRLDLTCRPLKQEEAQTILNAIFPEYVTVEYTDPMYGDVIKNMYSNNNPATYVDTDSNMWEGISFPLIER